MFDYACIWLAKTEWWEGNSHCLNSTESVTVEPSPVIIVERYAACCFFCLFLFAL